MGRGAVLTRRRLRLLYVSLIFPIAGYAPKARAHGTEFLLGKLTLSPGTLRLELTADCEGNPMIADRTEAASVLPAVLQIRSGDSTRPLPDFAPVSLENRTKFDETAPLPPGAFDNSIDHQLLTAVWQWRPDQRAVRFEVPKDCNHTVLLWVIDSEKPKDEPRWMMLLSGDATPEIKLTMKPTVWNFRWWMISGGALAAMLLAGRRSLLRLHGPRVPQAPA